MANKIIASFLLCLGCLLPPPGGRANQTLSADELAGTYTAGFKFGGSSITLKADGSYSADYGSCTYSTRESGRYVLSGGRLRFTILKLTGKSNGDGSEADLLDPMARRKFYNIPGDEKLEPVKTEYSLIPVKWEERIYLISENGMREFIDAVNLGLEPRPTLSSETFYGLFHLREGDEKKAVAGKPSLPDEWQSFILSEPVTGEVIALEEHDQYQIATINRGSRDGLKAGMKLVSKEQEPSPWSEAGLILTVEEQSAKVKVFDLKIGDSLSSKYVPGGMNR